MNLTSTYFIPTYIYPNSLVYVSRSSNTFSPLILKKLPAAYLVSLYLPSRATYAAVQPLLYIEDTPPEQDLLLRIVLEQLE